MYALKKMNRWIFVGVFVENKGMKREYKGLYGKRT
jgi:hypothetical protein